LVRALNTSTELLHVDDTVRDKSLAMAFDSYVNDTVRDKVAGDEPSVAVTLRYVKSSTSRVNRAGLVRMAEAAVDYARPEDAQEALDMYFGFDPIHDQYFVRALYTSAELQSLRASLYGGRNRLDLVLAAIETLLSGLSLAEKGGSAGDSVTYKFLIYNGSVHHWNVVRPLLRPGYRRHAIFSLQKIADALALAEDPDLAWRVRHHMLIALCCYEALQDARQSAPSGPVGAGGVGGAMQAALVVAWDLAGQVARRDPLDPASARLVEDVIRLSTHICTTALPGAITAGGALTIGKSASVPFSLSQLGGGPPFLTLSDMRSRTTAALQALWSATATAITDDAIVSAADSSSLLCRVRRTRGSDDIRSRLLDLMHVGAELVVLCELRVGWRLFSYPSCFASCSNSAP
jgi:hypothetical protein